MSEISLSNLIVLFVGISIFMSIISYELKRYTNIPVSFSLILLGMGFEEICPHINLLSDIKEMIIKFDIRLINYVFLPVIIFESCLSANWYIIRKEIWQILILSTSVAVSCTFLNGVSLKYIFGYSYEFNHLLLFGLVFSFTDHFTAKALLKEIYASSKLKTLIVGETMFNLAILLIVFEVLHKKIEGLSGFENTMILICRLTFGGLGIGILFAASHAVAVRRMVNDRFSEIVLTLTVVYLLNWVSEYEKIHVSGPLSLLVYGLFMSLYGKTFISVSVENELRTFFEILARNSESLLFIIGGILFALLAFGKESLLTARDYWSLFLIFPVTYAIRGLVLLIHFPLLKRIGYQLSLKEIVFLCFGGFKGVISVSLASIIGSDPSFSPHQRFLINYFGIGIAILSIVLGGIATKLSSKYLGLEKLSNSQENILIGVTSALIETSNNRVLKMKGDQSYHLADWTKVSRAVGCEDLVRKIVNKTSALKQKLDKGASNKSVEFLCNSRITVSNEQLTIDLRRRFLSTLKWLYWKRFKKGLCTGMTSLILISSVEVFLDKESEPMSDWKIVEASAYNKRMIYFLRKLSNVRLIGRIGRRFFYKKIILAYTSALSFIRCHEQAEYIVMKQEINNNKKIFKTVIKESHRQIELCRKFMNMYIFDSYPEIISEVQTKQAEQLLLENQRKIVKKIYEQGLIQELEFESLIGIINSSINKSTFDHKHSIPKLKDTLTNRFKSASPEEISDLLEKVKIIEIGPGASIFIEGETANGAYLILRGRAKEFSSWIDQDLIIGNIIGVQYLIEEYSQVYLSSSSIVTNGLLLHIPQHSLSSHGFLKDLYEEAAEELLLLNRKKYELVNVAKEQIFLVISKSKAIYFRNEAKKVLNCGALVLNQGKNGYKSKWIFKPRAKKRRISQDSVLLILPNSFEFLAEDYMGDSFNKFTSKTIDDLLEEDLNRFSQGFYKTIKASEYLKDDFENSSLSS